ncbi:carbohydrate porin [Beijerinckia sp. L45]|uniref:carbohydrate porin n=1 Tax=Beijerinckia sp. L45 TaxID=1641855 RepID=UPI00131B8D4A|nr:carbohydrate porin [Beijerinckia sp. L45]
MKQRYFESGGIGLVAIGLLALTVTAGKAAEQSSAALDTPNATAPTVSVAQKRRIKLRHRAVYRGGATGSNAGRISPDSHPAALAAPVAAGPTGPLSKVGKAFEDAGITLHLFEVETYYNNLNSGIVKNSSSNTAFFVAGADFDMGHIANITGGTVHVEEQLFHGEVNVLSTGARYGGLTSGYEPVYNPTDNQLTVLTYEQKFANDKLDIEIGRTNALRAFILPICPNLVSCWNDVVEQDARTRTGHSASWGARAAYNITPALYVQAGAYEDNPDAEAEHGFNFAATKSTGAILLGEVGYKTDYTTAKYPERVEAVGFYNTSTVADPYFTTTGQSAALNPGQPLRMNTGDGGFVLDAIKTVWRADGGLTDNLHPTALAAYASVSAPVTSGALVSMESYVGLTLLAPFQSRPFDTFGAKIHFTQLSNREQAYLQDSNIAAGGSGYTKSRNGIEFELSSHHQIASYLAINTTIQYFANNNNFYNPASTVASRDGFYFGMDAAVPIGAILGLSSQPY